MFKQINLALVLSVILFVAPQSAKATPSAEHWNAILNLYEAYKIGYEYPEVHVRIVKAYDYITWAQLTYDSDLYYDAKVAEIQDIWWAQEQIVDAWLWCIAYGTSLPIQNYLVEAYWDCDDAIHDPHYHQ